MPDDEDYSGDDYKEENDDYEDTRKKETQKYEGEKIFANIFCLVIVKIKLVLSTHNNILFRSHCDKCAARKR